MEVLVSVIVVGLLIGVLSTAVVVVTKQSATASARVDTARTEQLLGMTLPTDLASADDMSTDPTASPCFGQCPAGTDVSASSNALLLMWTTYETVSGVSVTAQTRVSYRYTPAGVSYELVRVECRLVGTAAQTCAARTAARSLPPPPGGVFDPTVSPEWALNATRVDGSTGTPPYADKQAIQVIVRIVDQAVGGGQQGAPKDVVMTVGSAERKQVTSDSFNDDLIFGEPPSRCSGTLGVIVDTSASINQDLPTVRTGVAQMLDAFRGTPVRIQVVNFGGKGYTVSPTGTEWPYYWDMINVSQVNELIGSNARGGLISGLTLTGGTNWEDALFRMFKNRDGTDQAIQPDKLIFFTDGEPWGHMAVNKDWSSTGTVFPHHTADQPFLDTGTAPSLQPRLNRDQSWKMIGFHRAARLLDQYDGSTEVVMVGVGPVVNLNKQFILNEGGYHMEGSNKVFAPPYTAYQRKNMSIPGRDILKALLVQTGNPVIEPTMRPDGSYDTSTPATFYPVPDFAKMGAALRALAVGQCGGTLTLQTRYGGGFYDGEVSYSSTTTTKKVTTSAVKPNGTFDYSIADPTGMRVIISPTPVTDSADVEPGTWACISGTQSVVPEVIDDPTTAWDSIALKVTPAAAISCTLELVPA